MHFNFERAIELDPQNSTAYLWFGVALSYFGLHRQAIDQLRTAVEIDPLVPVNYGVLGILENFMTKTAWGFSICKRESGWDGKPAINEWLFITWNIANGKKQNIILKNMQDSSRCQRNLTIINWY